MGVVTLVLVAIVAGASVGCGDSETPTGAEVVQVIEEPTETGDGANPNPVRIRDIEDIRGSVIVEDDVPVVVRDGTTLSARVFRPAARGRHPVIMALTAYSKDLGPDDYPEAVTYGELPGFDPGTFEVSEWTSWEAPDPATWVPLGYAVVYLDVRGYHASGGEASVLSAQEGEDAYDAIEWAAAQEWSNGNVGLMGVSYLAIAQWVAAGTHPPSLKAIVPWEGQTDSFREVLYHGGVPETAFTEYWLTRLNGAANTPPLPPWPLIRLVHPFPRLLQLFTPPQAIHLSRVTVPALVCASWSDHGMHTRGSFEAYKQIRSAQKWLFNHGRQKWAVFYSDEAIDAQRRFLDHFLKGEDTRIDEVRSVRLEVRESLEEYRVRYEDDWPIARTEYRRLYLDGRTGALTERAATETFAIGYAPLVERAVFTRTFDGDTELTGNAKLKLWVSTSEGDDMDLFVGLEKLDAEGRRVHFHGRPATREGRWRWAGSGCRSGPWIRNARPRGSHG